MIAALFFAHVLASTLTILFTDRLYERMTFDLVKRLIRFGHNDKGNKITVFIIDPDDRGFRREWMFGDLPINITSLPERLRNARRDDYFEKISPRMSTVSYLLAQTGDDFDGILMLDSDVVIFRNIAARIEALQMDVVAQREIPCKRFYCINAGVVWFKTRCEWSIRTHFSTFSTSRQRTTRTRVRCCARV